MEEKFFKAGKTVGGFIKTLLLPAILSVALTICSKIMMTRMSEVIKDYIEVIKSPHLRKNDNYIKVVKSPHLRKENDYGK